jgi:hypothetical protein
VWERGPKIQGTARQEVTLHWRKADAEPASIGKAVFNESNGCPASRDTGRSDP